MILGVDPGLSGALVLMDKDSIHQVLHMPVQEYKGGREVNANHLYEWLVDRDIEHAYFEAVHSMSGQGVRSTWTFARAVGMTEACLTCAGIQYTMVQPRAWKAHFSLIGQDKDASRIKVQKMMDHPDLSKKAKGQAIADAALIALYGRDYAK